MSEKGDELRICVVDRMPRKYSGIIRFDLLEKVGVRIRNNSGQWVARLERRNYKCRRSHMKKKNNIGAIT